MHLHDAQQRETTQHSKADNDLSIYFEVHGSELLQTSIEHISILRQVSKA